MSSKFSQLLLVVMLAVFGLLAGCDAAPPQTNLATALKNSPDQKCVEPKDQIRRNHMAMLMHQRDETVIQGIRTKKHSLEECINCHVAPTKEDGSPLHYGDKEHFCTTCHAYAGVKIDCFQCHADRPEVMQDPNYQHTVGSAESHHFTNGMSSAAAPTVAEVQMVAQPQQGAAQ